MLVRFLLGTLLFIYGAFSYSADSMSKSLEPLKHLPVQDGGRVKPYDTFARETLQLLHGKQTYEEKDASEVVFTMMLLPAHWDQIEFLQVRYNGLKDALKLEKTKNFYSPTELLKNERLQVVMGELNTQREARAKLNNYFQAVQRLENQLTLYNMLTEGTALRVLPQEGNTTWLSLKELNQESREKFDGVAKGFVDVVAGKEANLNQAVADFMQYAKNKGSEGYSADYPTLKAEAIEVHYNTLHPFQKAYGLYLLGVLLAVLAWNLRHQKRIYLLAWFVTISAFLMHTYGFGIRVYLTGRPPVSNMYESVIWVSWGVILFSIIFEAIYRSRFIMFGANVVASLCLIVADFAPAVLDSSLQPLEPVLRSNLWLTIHVLTITISYSAFFLAFVLADVGLAYYLRGGEAQYKKQIESVVKVTYRTLQVGVVLLAAGTILGGVWADYSWGRFWGWDPKETWAFIALLGYLALLHARLTGLVKNFGILAGSVLAFSLVLMAWYGVNYVLGAGLHSYGFGGGGIQYVSAFVALHIFYVVLVYVLQKKNLNTSKI